MLFIKQEAQPLCDIFPQIDAQKKSNVQKINVPKNPILTKIISLETLSKEISTKALGIYAFKNRQNRSSNWTIGHFCIFNLSTFQSKRHNPRPSETVSWEKHFKLYHRQFRLDEKIQICSFRDQPVGLPRYVNINSTFLLSCQSGLHI